MKDRPILFSAPMVRAILEGRKTQTRRIIKPQPVTGPGGSQIIDGKSVRFCLGDRLWVKERFGYTTDSRGQVVLIYSDDATAKYVLAEDGGEGDYAAVGKATDRSRCSPCYRWKPSIHMPRWASRITLEVTGLRVERVQDISEADAVAEGVEPYHCPQAAALMNAVGSKMQPIPYTSGFANLWNEINGPLAWAENPWVWVVEFRMVDQ